VNMVSHQVAFQNLCLLMTCQLVEYLPQRTSQFPK
jgi:hypothetical protein